MAKRIALTDGSNTYFDKDRATKYDEDTNWDGHNNVSVATGSEFNHQILYRTANGSWVLHSWSQQERTVDKYEAIPDADAFAWLVCDGHFEAVPIVELVSREI